MSFTRICTLLALFIFVGVTAAHAQAEHYTLSGKLMNSQEQAPCDRCQVSLENFGVPIGSVLSDSIGNFAFTNLTPGVYTVRVEVEGFEKIEQRVEVSSLFEGNMIIMLNPKIMNGDADDSQDVVHVASYLNHYPEKAVNLYKKAEKSSRKGKSEEAIQDLQRAIEIAPDFYHAHNLLGLLYKAAGRFDEAEKEFETAETLNDSSPEPLINLSGLYIEDNQPERAIEVGEEAIKRDKRSAPAFFNLGLALYRASKFLRAQDALQQALSLAPKMGQARLALANVFMRLQNWNGLREQLHLYLHENPKSKDRAAVEEFLKNVPEESLQ